MSSISTAAGLVTFPVLAAAVGSTAAAVRRPSPKVTSGVQHLAAGVVFAAVSTELLPDLLADGHLPVVIVGFSVGVALLLALAAWGRRQEAATTGGSTTGAGLLPVGMLAAVAIDLFIDGTLVGLGATLGRSQGIILTVALTLEILFLAVSVCIELLDAGLTNLRAAGIAAGLGLFTALGAMVSAIALHDASTTVVVAVLAFGAAALLYLIVEELLVEAHEEEETSGLTAMFFLGFIVLFALAELGS